MPPPSHLIVVCCHGIWLGGPSKGHDESSWLIAGFQRGETPTFIEHIRAGVECMAKDPLNSVLVFSGGPTRLETELSEARSYLDIAKQNDYFNLGIHQQQQDNILVEDRALDSYQNVLFSLTLFFARFSAWPVKLTIVSHGFKKPRIVDGHCVAIGWPLERVEYVGIDPPGMRPEASDSKEDAMRGVALAIGEWMEDPHGKGQSLKGKRRKRNPWDVWQGVFGKSERDSGSRSNLITRGQGEDETLVEDAVRPWL